MKGLQKEAIKIFTTSLFSESIETFIMMATFPKCTPISDTLTKKLNWLFLIQTKHCVNSRETGILPVLRQSGSVILKVGAPYFQPITYQKKFF